jgi:hypothetical protein
MFRKTAPLVILRKHCHGNPARQESIPLDPMFSMGIQLNKRTSMDKKQMAFQWRIHIILFSLHPENRLNQQP